MSLLTPIKAYNSASVKYIGDSEATGYANVKKIQTCSDGRRVINSVTSRITRAEDFRQWHLQSTNQVRL